MLMYIEGQDSAIILLCQVWTANTKGKSVLSPSRLGSPYRHFTWQAAAELMLKNNEFGNRIYPAAELFFLTKTTYSHEAQPWG
jgi:hypothetical protein